MRKGVKRVRGGALWALGGTIGLSGVPAVAQPDASLAEYFGFGDQRALVVDPQCGPVVSADMNGDKLPDVIIANNRKSRIDLMYLRSAPRGEEDVQRAFKVNELPPNAWYDDERVSVAHRLGCVRIVDADRDGKPDIVYAGIQPQELVVLRQESPSSFVVHSKRRVKGLGAGQDSLVIADVMGDDGLEILALVDGGIGVFPLSREGVIGDQENLGTGGGVAAIFVEDYDGNGLLDVMGAIPANAAPVRLWLQESVPSGAGKRGLMARELRFEMPGLTEAEPIRFPGRKAASIGVIERASRRMVFFDLVTGTADSMGGGAEREVLAEVGALRGGASKDRSVAVGDLTGDGLLDLLAADQRGHAVVLHTQRPGLGLDSGESFGTFKDPSQIAIGAWEAGAGPAIFVLSETERAVGVTRVEGGRIAFPRPLTIKTPGGQPVAMQPVEIAGRPHLAVVVRDRRDMVLELHAGVGATGEAEGAIHSVPLTGITKSPKAVLAADADGDGLTDLLLLTPGEPMVMLRGTQGDGGALPRQMLTNKEMSQFGLVQAAGPSNSALMDVDGDGRQELLIATANFVRACVYDGAKGWRVTEQMNLPDPSTDFAGVTLLRDEGQTRIVAADKANSRLVMFAKDSAGRWGVRERVRLLGFPVGEVYAGAFSGKQTSAILCVGEDGFASVALNGDRARLEQFAAFRSEADDRLEHEMEAGDLNSDGYVDIAVLDAREQMCEIYTFSASRRLLPATEFEVFQSRLFQGGEAREYEPSAAIIGDLTGDAAHDLLLLVHDRVLIYPQMTKK